MKLRAFLAAVAVVAAVAAAGAAATGDRPEETALASSSFTVTATFTNLTPSVRYDFTWTAHFPDGDAYTRGGSGRASDSTGTLVVTSDLFDLVYYDPGKPLEWVRVCLRPVDSRVDVLLVAADGKPLCVNIETGGYRSTGYEDEGDYAAAPPAAAPLTVTDRVAAARAAILSARHR